MGSEMCIRDSPKVFLPAVCYKVEANILTYHCNPVLPHQMSLVDITDPYKNKSMDWRGFQCNWESYLKRAKMLINAQCSKIGKKCNFKSTKTHFLPFQKWQKINFCTRKKFKNTKNAIFGLFSVAKIDFLPFLK